MDTTIADRSQEKNLHYNVLFFYFFYFCALWAYLYSIFRCGHRIRDPAPSHMRYSYIVIASSSESLTPGGLGLPGPQQLWGRPAYNHFGVRPNPTEHGLHALNPLLPGFEPRTCTIDPSRDSTVIASRHCLVPTHRQVGGSLPKPAMTVCQHPWA